MYTLFLHAKLNYMTADQVSIYCYTYMYVVAVMQYSALNSTKGIEESCCIIQVMENCDFYNQATSVEGPNNCILLFT